MTTSWRNKWLSWLVHAYTASGGLLGFLALIAIANGASHEALLLLMGAFFIDVTDGLLARWVEVREHLPGFSGAQVDDAMDVLTYIYAPLFLIVHDGLLPHPLWAIGPLLAGLYAYGQRDMKTEDHYFLGFPSYWNVVALYLFWLRPGPTGAVLVVLVPTVLTFIPTRYLYPSCNAFLWKTNFALGGVWLILVVALLLQADPPRSLVLLSLVYPMLYLLLSFYAEWRYRTARLVDPVARDVSP
tara:strand:- start:479 stop:1207 length:729 start_codon:yes stop_codon:yes gene_type:complete